MNRNRSLWLAGIVVLAFAALLWRRGVVNLALGKVATQSTTGFGGEASRAIDGNTSGDWEENSVTHNLGDAQPWWQVDLGKVYWLDRVVVWNRTDAHGELLAGFVVLVSDTPFVSGSLAETKAQAGVSQLATSGVPGPVTEVFVERTGRYVRIQLPTAASLHIAEVLVWGY